MIDSDQLYFFVWLFFGIGIVWVSVIDVRSGSGNLNRGISGIAA